LLLQRDEHLHYFRYVGRIEFNYGTRFNGHLRLCHERHSFGFGQKHGLVWGLHRRLSNGYRRRHYTWFVAGPRALLDANAPMCWHDWLYTPNFISFLRKGAALAQYLVFIRCYRSWVIYYCGY